MPRIRLSSRITDSDPGRPVAQALRELANLTNEHDEAIPMLLARIDQLTSTQLTPDQIRTALSTTGITPLNPPSVPGSGTATAGAILIGPHATRIALASPHVGTLFYETDRHLLYAYQSSSGWVYVAGVLRRTLTGDDTDDTSPPVSGPGDDTSDGGDTEAGVLAAGPTGRPAGPYDGTAYRAGLIIGGTANEFPSLTAATADQATRDANMLELLLLMIGNLQFDGYSAGRQRNPSGLLSIDKLTVVEDGSLRAFDVFAGVYTSALTIQAIQVSPANIDDPCPPSRQKPAMTALDDVTMTAAYTASFIGLYGRSPTGVPGSGIDDTAYWIGQSNHYGQFSDHWCRAGWSRYWERKLAGEVIVDPAEGDVPALY